MHTQTPPKLGGKTIGQLRIMAREDATAALNAFWNPHDIPVDLIAVARRMGASVFTAQLGDDVYGMVQGDPAGANIYVDRDSAPVRQRFTISRLT